MVNHTKNAMPTNEYIITYQNTSSWKTLESLFKMSPISFLCFSATLLSGLFRLQRYRTFDLTCYLSIISAVWILSICSLDYMQNLRYLSTIILPYYLLAALGFYEFIKIIRTSIKNEFIIIAISLLILLGSFYDYYTFQTLLVNKSIGDLSVGLILKYW